MSDTISTVLVAAPHNVERGDTRPPIGTRILVTEMYPDSLARAYVGKVGRTVDGSGTLPRAKFDEPCDGDDTWYVSGWVPLPEVGQKVTIVECLEAATQGFTDWATGKEATYLEHTRYDMHRVLLTDPPYDFPTEPGVKRVQWSPGVGLSNPVGLDLPERERRTPDERTEAIREREAAAAYERLVVAINDAAVENEWCGEFEEWAERHDVEVTRCMDKEFSVSITLTYDVDADTAASWLRREHGGDHYDVDASDCSVTSDVSITMTLSGETPDDVDSYVIERALSDADYSGYSNWDINNWDES